MTMKAHILHNFWTSTHREGGSFPPSGSATGCPLWVTLAMAEVREVTTSTVVGIEELYNLQFLLILSSVLTPPDLLRLGVPEG